MIDPIVYGSANGPTLNVVALRPKDAMERDASACVKRDRHEQINSSGDESSRFGLFRRALSQMRKVLHMWHDLYRMRLEMARLSEQDLHDIGRFWGDI
jgi:uncharacterized protein YjiS (DUF1127 family)